MCCDNNNNQVANKADLVPAGTVMQSIDSTAQQQQQQQQLWRLSCRTGDGVEVRT
jgi:Ni2+-binding GTPase involved in maturation of urease and hydrogenase